MKQVIQLLEDKNMHLEKFFRANEAELENFSAGNFDNLEDFYRIREGLLEVIRKIDDMIEASNNAPDQNVLIDEQERRLVMSALQYKTDLVNRILEQDLCILSAIETAKSDIIKELAQVRSARKAIGSYKSGAGSAKRVDEEA